QKQPLVVCLTDGTDPALLRSELSEVNGLAHPEVPIAYVDFTREFPGPDELLQSLLRSPVYRPEFRDIGIGESYADEFFKFVRERDLRPHASKRASPSTRAADTDTD